VATDVSEFESIVQSGAALTRAQAEGLLASTDLIGVGLLGEMARRAISGDRVTYGRVCTIASLESAADPGEAGELRLAAKPGSIEEARAWIRSTVPFAAGRPFSAFSLADIATLAGPDPAAVTEACRALLDAGLEAIAEAPIDELGDASRAIAVVRAAQRAGVAVRRATISRGAIDVRLDLIERAAAVQQETGAFKAFAPLPSQDPADSPATGYDDVRTIAAARLMCRSIPFIQVDWAAYGPKLAQVAIAYGANDLDGVAATDRKDLGPRRSAREEIERQIRAAFATPIERDGRYAVRA
jgi:2-iminoacetate synthase ThiH